MKLFFVKPLLRKRLVLYISLLLLAAAGAALCIGCSLFQSARKIGASAEGRFHVLPFVDTHFPGMDGTAYDGMQTLDGSHHGSDESEGDRNATSNMVGADWYLGALPAREALYRETFERWEKDSYTGRDDRRAYLGYAQGRFALRSEDVFTSIGEHAFLDFSAGSGTYEKVYSDIVADVTLIEKEMLHPGSPALEEGIELIGADGEMIDEILPCYFYTFQINRILAENSSAPVQSQRLYVTINQEMFYAANLEPGMRCLLYGDYLVMDEWGFGPKSDSAAALQAEKGPFYYLSLEQGIIYENGEEIYTGLNCYTALPSKAELDCSSLEAFTQSSGLASLEAAHWYAIIENCKEIVESFYVVTTEDLERALPFGTDAMHLLEGRGITAADREAVCVISAELAKQQDIRVGEALTLRLRDTAYFFPDGLFSSLDSSQPWALQSPADWYKPFVEIEYEVVGIYQSMGWNDAKYAQYLNPGTIFVSAAATPKSGNEYTGWRTPQVMWGFYLKNPDDADAFLASLPEDLRDSVRIVDQGYSHVKPLLAELRSNARTILLITLAVWLAVVGIFLFIHVFRAKHTMGTLRSLGMPKRKVFSVFLLACMALWLVGAVISGIASAFLYDKLEAQAFQNVFQSGAYNQAFSDIGTGADQGTNPWTGETDGLTGDALMQRVYSAGVAVPRVLLSLGIQGVLFLGICALTIWLVSRKKTIRLLKGT